MSVDGEIPDVFVINRDQDKLRYQFVANQLSALNIPHKRLSATIGADLPTHVVEAHWREDRKRLTFGEIGCIQSHVQLWKTLVSSGKAMAVVLEDDVHISPNMRTVLRDISQTLDHGAIVKLEASPMKFRVERTHTQLSGPYRVHRLNGFHLGTAAYVITKDAAESLISQSEALAIPIDLFMFDPSASHWETPRYQTLPGPCIQDCFLEHGRQAFDSVIGVNTAGPQQRPVWKTMGSAVAQALHNLAPGSTMHASARFA